MKHFAATGLLLALSAISVRAQTADPTRFETIGPDQLAFSARNMDLSADPRVDFYRYASGNWLKRIERPERLASIGAFDFMIENTKRNLGKVFETAAAAAPTAPRGSPTQQVGDFYRAYMDTARQNALGIRALAPQLAEIDAIAAKDDIAGYLGRYAMLTGDIALAVIGPSTDQADNSRMSLYFVPGRLILKQEQTYDEPDTSPRIVAYLDYLRSVLAISGWDSVEAETTAKSALAIERALYRAKLTPAEAVDPRVSYNPGPRADLQAAIPELDLARLMRGAGIEPADIIVQTEPRFLPVLSALIRKRTLDEIRRYLKLKLIVRFLPYLGEAYEAPVSAINKALIGIAVLPPRAERAGAIAQEYLGHPLSRLYVEAYFPDDSRARTRDMIGRIRAAFLARMQTRSWLTEPTRKAALEKLDRLAYKIGYPDTWIDFTAVDIRADDLVGSIIRLNAFSMGRDAAKIGKPAVPDQFAVSGRTLPVTINAAYNSLINGFEIPAAFLQPPAFMPDGDAASNFCRVGAVIGHEMTHGFDSGGRMFDSKGNMRDWWTPVDAAAFDKEAQKLVEQANAFEVLPGLRARGVQEVKENMADVGGINFAFDALLSYLKDHPDEDRIVEGLTARQRCFVSWAQLWTMKATDQAIRNEVLGDGHPPGLYRAVAAIKHVDGFYEAFGIRPGDPMWLPPDKRVSAW